MDKGHHLHPFLAAPLDLLSATGGFRGGRPFRSGGLKGKGRPAPDTAQQKGDRSQADGSE
jgi:hypothetical protein